MNGSSPQAWGTSDCRVYLIGLSRFIPTGVGNMSDTYKNMMVQAVHPHRRGEHRPPLHGCKNEAGSSPQAWGT